MYPTLVKKTLNLSVQVSIYSNFSTCSQNLFSRFRKLAGIEETITGNFYIPTEISHTLDTTMVFESLWTERTWWSFDIPCIVVRYSRICSILKLGAISARQSNITACHTYEPCQRARDKTLKRRKFWAKWKAKQKPKRSHILRTESPPRGQRPDWRNFLGNVINYYRSKNIEDPRALACSGAHFRLCSWALVC